MDCPGPVGRGPRPRCDPSGSLRARRGCTRGSADARRNNYSSAVSSLTNRASGEIGRPLASDTPFTGEQIAALVAEVADALRAGDRRHTIIVAGGSLLAWHGLRDTTVDVD